MVSVASATASAVERPAFREEILKDFLVAAALHQLDRVRGFIETLGLHPDSTFGGKPTALCYAVLKPCPCLMDYLLSRGADINRADKMGMTPLHYAAMGGSEYCLASLIANGGTLNRYNRLGKTPLALTMDKPHLKGVRELLLCHGALLHEAEPRAPRFH